MGALTAKPGLRVAVVIAILSLCLLMLVRWNAWYFERYSMTKILLVTFGILVVLVIVGPHRKIRHLVEMLTSTFLFVFQYIPVAGPWLGLMIFPLIIYISGLMWAYPDMFGDQIYLLLLKGRLTFGRVIVVIGFIIFLVACIQFLRRKEKIITTGVYSVVRHPQYLGISVMTLGLTITCIQFIGGMDDGARLTWLFQMLGYILLATYEEHYLLKEHKKEYQQYSQKVPFIFPIQRIPKTPEPLVSMILALIIASLLSLL